MLFIRTCSSTTTGAAAAASGLGNAELQHNHYHDSKRSDDDHPAAEGITRHSSLVTPASSSSSRTETGQPPPPATTNGQSVIRAAKAAYEQKLKAPAVTTVTTQTTKTTKATKNVHLMSFSGGDKDEAQARLSATTTSDGVKSDERTEAIIEGGGEEVTQRPEAGSGTLVDGPEVFLGGSCNPTTWRADVAMPTLNKLGISFYNPQVSDWTPDLIELEHRAKEKARVLFFVMDSETRATAGAIEAAHIAGLNTKQLVLVLHPYKMNQKILNETVSKQ